MARYFPDFGKLNDFLCQLCNNIHAYCKCHEPRQAVGTNSRLAELLGSGKEIKIQTVRQPQYPTQRSILRRPTQIPVYNGGCIGQNVKDQELSAMYANSLAASGRVLTNQSRLPFISSTPPVQYQAVGQQNIFLQNAQTQDLRATFSSGYYRNQVVQQFPSSSTSRSMPWHE